MIKIKIESKNKMLMIVTRGWKPTSNCWDLATYLQLKTLEKFTTKQITATIATTITKITMMMIIKIMTTTTAVAEK